MADPVMYRIISFVLENKITVNEREVTSKQNNIEVLEFTL